METFTDDHGVSVSYRCWQHRGAKGIVAIAHGASEHSGRYDRFAQALNAADYAVYAIDHRGHGMTRGSTGVGAAGPGGFMAIVDDLHVMRRRAEDDLPGTPLVVFGHSMGSLVAQAYVEAHGGLAGYVLSGCPAPLEGVDELLGALRSLVDSGQGEAPVDLFAATANDFGGRTKYDWLSRDDAEVDKYLADELCGDDNPLTARFVLEMIENAMAAFQPAALARTPSLPVLSIIGDKDPAGDMGAKRPALTNLLRVAGLDITSLSYPDARHELLNETNREDVTRDVISWLDDVVSRRPA